MSVLARALPGCRVDRVDVLDPVVLRTAVPGDARDLLTGRHVTGVQRRAHFVVISFDGGPSPELAIHPMLAGRFMLCPPDSRRTKDTALVLALSRVDAEPRELRYRDERQMGKVWVLRPDQRGQAPGLSEIGIDVLGPEFTRERFRALCKKRTDQAKNFLLDKSALDAMGNAYADEVLWAARIHPKARVGDPRGAHGGARRGDAAGGPYRGQGPRLPQGAQPQGGALPALRRADPGRGRERS